MEKLNPDRILTEEERNACKEAFDAFDKFGYGSLDHDEIMKVLEGFNFPYICSYFWIELGQKPSKEDLFKMISQVDKENKGFIGKENDIEKVAKQ